MIKNQKLRRFLMLDKRRKRTTFLRMFAESLVIVLFFSAVFAYLSRIFIQQYLYSEADKEIARSHSNQIERLYQNENRPRAHFADAYLSCYTFFNLEMPIFLGSRHRIALVSAYEDYSEKCNALSVLMDEDNNIVATSKRKLITNITFKKDKDLIENGWYVCDHENLDIPDLNAFFDKFYKYPQNEIDYIDFRINSAYINKAEHLMIPHEIDVNYVSADFNTKEYLYDTNIIKTESYVINADVDGYELTDIYTADTGKYPRAFLANLYGTPPDAFDEIWNENKEAIIDHTTWGYSSEGISYSNDDTRVIYLNSKCRYEGRDMTLCTIFRIKIWNKNTNKAYIIIVTAFTLILLILALTRCWRRNVLNKADYAFEDYQKALTNNLAHDLKTPLAAIGGYAENLMETANDEKQQKYLRSILDNVAYTDSIISNTLELNGSDSIKKIERTTFSLDDIVSSSVEKYKAQLDDRGIKISTEGSMKVKADRNMMTSAVENLVSNAVKYTPDGGEIKIIMNKRQFKIVNNVSEKVDTHDLTKPFIRGDKARSGKAGSGLGLSIAEKALNKNGFFLGLDCSDKQFSAVFKN